MMMKMVAAIMELQQLSYYESSTVGEMQVMDVKVHCPRRCSDSHLSPSAQKKNGVKT
jgi:hypothetical protein